MALYVNDFNKHQADDSGKYSINKGAILAIANPYIRGRPPDQDGFQGVIMFKGFIDSFSFDRAMKQKNITPDRGDIYQEIREIGGLDKDSYKFDIKVASGSPNEAIANHYKLQFLYRILGNESIECTAVENPKLVQNKLIESESNGAGTGDRKSVAVGVNLYLANLISNHPGGSVVIPDYSHRNVIKYGQPGVIEDCTYQPDMEMGFYESKGRVFAKVFTLSFVYVVEGPGVSERFESFTGADGKKYWTHKEGDEPRPFGFRASRSKDYRKILNNDGE